MTRIELEDSAQSALIKMADGNPGAITVMIGLLKRADDGLLDLLHLDTVGLYGPDIWIAYKDICGEDLDALSDRLRSDSLSLSSDVKLAAR